MNRDIDVAVISSDQALKNLICHPLHELHIGTTLYEEAADLLTSETHLTTSQDVDLFILDGRSAEAVDLQWYAVFRPIPLIIIGDEPVGIPGNPPRLSRPFLPIELIKTIEILLSIKLEGIEKVERQQAEYLLNYGREVVPTPASGQSLEERSHHYLRDLERTKDVFLSIVSHELRTPLTVMKGQLHLLRRLLRNHTRNSLIWESLEDAWQASQRLENLVNELLNFSWMKSGLSELKPTHHSLNRLLGNIRMELSPLARNHNCKLIFSIPRSTLDIEADPQRLREAITHLIKNAILFNKPGGTVTVAAQETEEEIELIIQDTGKGIPPEDLKQVFSPFYQSGDILTKPSEGLGLGLSIARHIVEAHGGELTLESTPGEGTTVTMCLPKEFAGTPSPKFDSQEILSLPQTPTSISSDELLAYLRELNEALDAERIRRRHLEQINKDLERTFIETLAALVRKIDVRDSHQSSHIDRVSFYAQEIARRLDPDLPNRRDFIYSLLLYDIGKIGVAESLLQKVEELTDEEMQLIRAHTEIGADLLSSIEYLQPAISGVRSHHERWDGTGYPDGLAGEDIPLIARIIAVADAFDAMTVDRPYRKALQLSEAKAEIQKNSGTHFDPKVVEAFENAWESLKEYRLSLENPQ